MYIVRDKHGRVVEATPFRSVAVARNRAFGKSQSIEAVENALTEHAAKVLRGG